MDSDRVVNKIGRGAGFILIGSVIGFIISLFYRIVLARMLGPEYYGIFSLVLMLIGLFSVFFGFGISNAVAKYTSEYLAKKKSVDLIFSNAFKIIVPLALISSFILFLASEYLAVIVFNSPGAILPFQRSSLILFFVLIAEPFKGGLTGFQRMEFSALGNIVEKLSKFVFSIILLYLGFEVLGATGAIVISTFLLLATCFFSYKKVSKISLKPLNPKIIRMLIGFSMPSFIASIGLILMGWIDTLFIGIFLSVEWVGYYNVALPVIWILGMFITSLAGALFPAFSEIKAEKDMSMIGKTFNRSLKYSLYLIVPAAVGAFILAEPIIRILFTSEYLPAVPAFQVLVFGAIFLSMKGVTGSYINGTGRPGILMKIAIVAVVVNIVLNWFLIQSHGILGAAYATSFSFAVLFFLSLNFIRKDIKLGFGYLPKSLVATLIMALFAWFTMSLTRINFIELITIVVVSIAIYFVALYILRGFDTTDRKLIGKTYRNIRGRVRL